MGRRAVAARNHDVRRAAALARRQHVEWELRINLVLTYKVQPPRGNTVECHRCDIAQRGR